MVIGIQAPHQGGRWLGLVRILLVGAVLFAASPSLADPPSNAPVATLRELGFVPAGTNIPIDGYVRLLVAVYAPGNQTNTAMNQCPKQGIWGIDLTNITEGDNHTTFGVKITDPGVTTPVTVIPLDFTKTASGFLWLSSDCNLKVDLVRYISPLYFVGSARDRQFSITPTYATNDALNPNLQAELNAAVGAATALAGVPAATAAPYMEFLKTNLANAKVATAVSFIQHPTIRSGPAMEVLTWTVEGAIRKTRTAPARDIVLIAQLVPVATIVPHADGAAWLPGAVLRSKFDVNVPGAAAPTDGTLGGYISTIASAELVAYTSATDAAANVACGALSRKIAAMGLSDRDSALAVWAEARQRVILTNSTSETVDNLTCLDDYWPELVKAGVSRTPKPPQGSPEVAGKPPSVAQMKMTTDIDSAFPMFFVSPLWDDQVAYADKIFVYPVAFGDAAAATMRGSTTINNSDGWTRNQFQRDQPMLAQVGCFAYFDLNEDSTNFAKSQGARSLMMAIGRVAPNGLSFADKEVAILATFANAPGGDRPKIEKLDILPTLTPEARGAMLAPLGSATHCASGYRPQLLFGN